MPTLYKLSKGVVTKELDLLISTAPHPQYILSGNAPARLVNHVKNEVDYVKRRQKYIFSELVGVVSPYQPTCLCAKKMWLIKNKIYFE